MSGGDPKPFISHWSLSAEWGAVMGITTPFWFPQKERGEGVEGSSPIPCNLALCHSCKLGPDICNSLPPFFYTSLFHFFILALFSYSNSPLLVSAHIPLNTLHICVKAALWSVFTYTYMELAEGIRALSIPGGLSNHCVTLKVSVYDVIR